MNNFLIQINIKYDKNERAFLQVIFIHYVKGILVVELRVHYIDKYSDEEYRNIISALQNNPDLTSQYIEKLFKNDNLEYIDLYSPSDTEQTFRLCHDPDLIINTKNHEYGNIKEGTYKFRITIPHEFKTAETSDNLKPIINKQTIGACEFTFSISHRIYWNEEKAAKIRKHDEIMKEKIAKYKEYNESQKEIKKQKRLAKKAKNRHIPKRLKQKKKRDKINAKKESK